MDKPERDSQGHIVLRLTRREYGALSEAVRYAQQDSEEGVGRLDPTLARIQRKLGEVPGAN